MNNKYSDIKTLGRSSIVPYITNEDPSNRHQRRKSYNLNYSEKLKQWCIKNEIKFDIKNDGEHWILKKDKNRFEWWPSSAKLVINQNWKRGIHCHDYIQLINFLGKRL